MLTIADRNRGPTFYETSAEKAFVVTIVSYHV